MAQLYGVSILTGVGFTLSLFIGTLAFEDESVMMQIRLSVLAASALSGMVAALVPLIAAPLVRRAGWHLLTVERRMPAWVGFSRLRPFC
jgi:Na+/H+ antiporter NhaA